MLRLEPRLDLHRDIWAELSRREDCCGGDRGCVVNIERDGGMLFHWTGSSGTTKIGKYDPKTGINKLLYTFDKQVCVSSCSLNKEETLLAVSLAQRIGPDDHLRPMSKCLSLLIEISPVNNTKVLKAVDCRVKVQFLYPDTDRKSLLESHLLLITEDGYADLYHVMLARHDGYRVVVVSPQRVSTTAERVAEDFSWVQWDTAPQRLFYASHPDKPVLRCIQFYSNRCYETVLELMLELPIMPLCPARFVNLGFDHYHQQRAETDLVRMEVFTNQLGSMCVCSSQSVGEDLVLRYSLLLVHRGRRRTFSVSLERRPTAQHPLFIPLGCYMLVCLPGSVLHCVSLRQDMTCLSLFLSGAEADLGLPGVSADLTLLAAEENTASLLDQTHGRVYRVEFSPAYLLQILQSEPAVPRRHSERLAALHCLLLLVDTHTHIKDQIIDWLCDHMTSFDCFDQMQEFILGSLYRISYDKCLSLDKVLPSSAVYNTKEQCLLHIPGVSYSSELHAAPVFMGKGRSQQGFWAELQWNTERIKYLDAVPHPRYTHSLQSPPPDRMSSVQHKAVEENAKKVLCLVDTWRLDKNVVPLFQEQDDQQRALIGLMVERLREHLNTHLPRLGRKRIESLVLNYTAQLLQLLRYMVDSVWRRYKLDPAVLCLSSQQVGPADSLVFHFMCRLMEASRSLCLPLPPGYHTVVSLLALRALPLQVFLQYVDQGLLQLTDVFTARLLSHLDNRHDNQALKLSVLKRLPQCQKTQLLWDHPLTSASICRDYVKTLLDRYCSQERVLSGWEKTGFLPLTYLTKILSDIEEKAVNPFEENVDSSFVEENALRQTLSLL